MASVTEAGTQYISDLVCRCASRFSKQSTLRDPVDGGLSSTVHGILKSRILEWVAVSSSEIFPTGSGSTSVACIDRWVLSHSYHLTRSSWFLPNPF